MNQMIFQLIYPAVRTLVFPRRHPLYFFPFSGKGLLKRKEPISLPPIEYRPGSGLVEVTGIEPVSE